MLRSYTGFLWLVFCSIPVGAVAQRGDAKHYSDGRPATIIRYEAEDQGIVLPFGGCPKDCDKYGARDVWVFEHDGKFYMHYDAAGDAGWLTALAVSDDLQHWTKRGTVLA